MVNVIIGPRLDVGPYPKSFQHNIAAQKAAFADSEKLLVEW
jgi:hypothetical protein